MSSHYCSYDSDTFESYEEIVRREDTHHHRPYYQPYFSRYRSAPSRIYFEANVPSRYMVVIVRFWNLNTQSEYEETLSIQYNKDRHGDYKKSLISQLEKAIIRLPTLRRRVRFRRDLMITSVMMHCDTTRRGYQKETQLVTESQNSAMRLLTGAHQRGALDYIEVIYTDGPLYY